MRCYRITHVSSVPSIHSSHKAMLSPLPRVHRADNC